MKIFFNPVVFLILWIYTSAFASLTTLQYGNVRLSAQENDWRFGEETVHIIQSALPRLIAQTGISEPVYVHVVIAPSEKEFHRMTGGQIPDWGVAAADPNTGIIFLKSPRYTNDTKRIRVIVVHELSHVLMGKVIKRTVLPRWFDEGLAMYFSEEMEWESNIILARSLITRQIIPLNEIDDVLVFRRDKAALAYRESLAAIEYLVEKNGKEVLTRIILSMSNGESVETAIRQKTGMSFTRFEVEWLNYLRERYLGYALLDTRVLLSFSFVALLLLAWMKKQYQSRRKMTIWKSEEFEDSTDHDSHN